MGHSGESSVFRPRRTRFWWASRNDRNPFFKFFWMPDQACLREAPPPEALRRAAASA